MNQHQPSKDDKAEVVLKPTKGNQIRTFNKENPSWINIPENEFPEDITNQSVLQIVEYRDIVNEHDVDVTVIQNHVIKQTDIYTRNVQTVYQIEPHKYSNEEIKPYFLSYLEDKPSGNSLEGNPSSCVKESSFNWDYSETSSISQVDVYTWVTPTSSQIVSDCLHGLIDKALSRVNRIPFATKLNKSVEPNIPQAIKFISLSCKNVGTDEINSTFVVEKTNKVTFDKTSQALVLPFEETVKAEDKNLLGAPEIKLLAPKKSSLVLPKQNTEDLTKITFKVPENLDLASLTSKASLKELPVTGIIICTKNSRGCCAQFVRKNNFEQETQSYDIESPKTRELNEIGSKSSNSTQIICSHSSAGTCMHLVRKKDLPENKIHIVSKEMSDKVIEKPLDNPGKTESDRLESDDVREKNIKCPTPEKCCHTPRPPCDEVRIVCRKGDVSFKLRCKKIGNESDENPRTVGNEIRYECEIIPEKNQCIDRKILESCDLKCCLVSNSHSRPLVVPEPVSCDKSENKKCESATCLDPNIAIPKGSTVKITLISSDPDDNGKQESNQQHKCEGKIYACRSKQKVNVCDDQPASSKECVHKACEVIAGTIDGTRNKCCELFEMIPNHEAHGKALGTIMCAAEAVLCKVFKPKNMDPNEEECDSCNLKDTICKSIQKSEKMYCDSCEKVKKIQKATHETFDKAKSMLGIKVCDECEEENKKKQNKPKLPPRCASYSKNNPDLESVYESVMNAAESAANSYTDIVDESMNALGIKKKEENKSPIEQLKQSVEDILKLSSQIIKVDAADDDAISKLKKIADKVSSTSQVIVDRTCETYDKVCNQAKEVYEEGMNIDKRAEKVKQNVERVLSGLTQSVTRKGSEGEQNTSGNKSTVPSTFSSLKGTVSSFNIMSVHEKSSEYDKPTPPSASDDEDKIDDTGMVSFFKNKIYSFFGSSDKDGSK